MKRISIFLFFLCAICFAQETGARYLIITPDNYYNVLQPLAEWKTRKGVKAKITTLSEIGGSDSTIIRNYIVNAYNNWQVKPEYLLLVGNKHQIPFPYFYYQEPFEMGYSDNYYTDVTGDFHNEIIPGRFWVYDTNETKTVVAKVLAYEKNPYLNDSLWFKKGVTIVNEDDEPPYDDSVYWADAGYVHNLMLNAGFVHINSLSESLGDDYNDVHDAINEGRSYILYRGLGVNNWYSPFAGVNPFFMNNGFKLPIIVSATCATVEIIGYWWLNSGTPEEPKGTIGFLGTTTVLSGAAEFRSALTRGTFESIFCDSFSTLGKAAEAGRLKYYDLFGNTLEYHSWTCLGDPEMTVWTTTPRIIQVIHNTEFYTRVCTVSVHAQLNAMPVESALVCVMAEQDTTFYHYGRTNNAGNIEFIDTLHIPGDSVFITVTGRNLRPYDGVVGVHFVGGPYVLLNSFSVSDSAGGNGDSIANPGEDIELPVWVRNWGDSTAYSVSGIIPIISSGSFFSLYDTIKDFGNISPLDSAYTSDDGYNIIIASNCPDMHQINLQFEIRDALNSTWYSCVDFMVHAPEIHYHDYYFAGNLKYIPAADTNQLFVELTNIGSYQAQNVIGKIFSDDSLFVGIDTIASFGTIPPNTLGTNQGDPFIIATKPETPIRDSIAIKIEVSSDIYFDTLEFMIRIGQKDYLIWDPDSNYSSGLVIKSKLDSLDFCGDYSTTFPYGLLSLYRSLFIGLAGYVIYDTSQAGQEIEEYLVTLGGKVYLEGPNVWYGNPYYHHGYDFGPLFHIQPVSNSILPGLITYVSGSEGTFTQSMIFNYSGPQSIIDRIAPIGSGISIFRKNSSNDTIIGVAANNQTVGLSFALRSLSDGIPPSTQLILVDSIMNYFGILPSGAKENRVLQYYSSPNLTVHPTLFRNSIVIRYNVGHIAKRAELKIYDVTGRLIRDFSQLLSYIGYRSSVISWDGTDDIGRKVPEGIYFIYFTASPVWNKENYKETKKIIMLK